MKIIMAGATGLVGSALVSNFTQSGHSVIRLIRAEKETSDTTIPWDPAAKILDTTMIENADVLICLSGESISQRWTQKSRTAIRDSRVNAATFLSESLRKLKSPPKLFMCASAVGYYGDRADATLSESADAGDDFLARVCIEWEHAASQATDLGIRCVQLRFGVVLSKEGGALSKMLLPFRMGLGGILGNGKQFMSWITLRNVVSSIQFIIDTESICGPVNVVSPTPITNREFTKALGTVLRRPTMLPVPVPLLKILLGDMAQGLLLNSVRATPNMLQQHGYQFSDPTILSALEHVLKKGNQDPT